MSSVALGDLAQSFMLQRRGAAVKSELARLTEELSSGRLSEPHKVLAGNHGYLADIEQGLRILASFDVASTEAQQHAGAMQSALEQVQNSSSDLGARLLLVSASAIPEVLAQGSTEAEKHLETIVSALNTDLAGRNLFSGVATDRAPLDGAGDILASARAVIAGATSAGQVSTMLRDWFDDPAGFAATHFKGSMSPPEPMRIAEGETVDLSLKADDPVFRDVLFRSVVAAVANDPALPLEMRERRDLLRVSGEGLIGLQQRITAERAELGTNEARIETISARIAAEQVGLDIARKDLLAADPFETATKLEETQFQLQALYSVTARLSGLSLVNFIR